MKPIEDIVCLVVDYGTFPCLASIMGERTKKTYYYSPYETEYRSIEKCVIGDGFDKFDRLDDFMDPRRLDEIDLFIFPDIGWGGLQRYLKSIGKLVWGSMGTSDLELYRTRFLSVIEDAGLPVAPYVVIRGLSDLSNHLHGVTNKWVKLNRYRSNCETFHHLDYTHTERELERLALEFGPLKDGIVFVVQDPIEGTDDAPVVECGYDGWCVDGTFPVASFQGYEDKNELYLGSLLPYPKQPESVRVVNEKMSSVLKEYGYRNFFATEIRVKDGTPYFIDITPRMAGQTMEHLTETCTNLPEIILEGSRGELVIPEFQSDFASEATLHYKTQNCSDGWKTITISDELDRWFKPYHSCKLGNQYHSPPGTNDEVGVICGIGKTIEDCIRHLIGNFDLLKDEPLYADIDGFADLLAEVKQAESQGIQFTDQKIPSPEILLNEVDE